MLKSSLGILENVRYGRDGATDDEAESLDAVRAQFETNVIGAMTPLAEMERSGEVRRGERGVDPGGIGHVVTLPGLSTPTGRIS